MRIQTKTQIRILPRGNTLSRCVSMSEDIVQVVSEVCSVKYDIEIISSRLRERQHRDCCFLGRMLSLLSSRPSGFIDNGTAPMADSTLTLYGKDLVFQILFPIDKVASVSGESSGILDGVDVKVADSVPGSNEQIITISSKGGPDHNPLFPVQKASLHILTQIIDKDNIVTTRSWHLDVYSVQVGRIRTWEIVGEIKAARDALVQIMSRLRSYSYRRFSQKDTPPPAISATASLENVSGLKNASPNLTPPPPGADQNEAVNSDTEAVKQTQTERREDVASSGFFDARGRRIVEVLANDGYIGKRSLGLWRNEIGCSGFYPRGYASVAEAVSLTDVEEDVFNEEIKELLDEMKKERRKENGNRRRVHQVMERGMCESKYQLLRSRQVKVETEAWEEAANEYRELLMDMCEHKLAPNLPYMKSLFLGWFEPSPDAIIKEQELYRLGKLRVSYAAYLDQLPAVITMDKLIGLLMTGKGHSCARVMQAACLIGDAIE
ncbi:hypothetical protein PTKIN_Ptkin04bG0208000 [Pterospermum kingtungense]